MDIQFSQPIAAQTRGNSTDFSIKAIGLHDLAKRASPVLVLDEFRVTGRPFPPHPSPHRSSRYPSDSRRFRPGR
jgi:hypothetical protein